MYLCTQFSVVMSNSFIYVFLYLNVVNCLVFKLVIHIIHFHLIHVWPDKYSSDENNSFYLILYCSEVWCQYD